MQLENGDVVLRDVENQDKPLMRFSFSDNIDDVLRGEKLDITKAMLEAGIKRHHELLLQKESSLDGLKSGYYH